MLKRTFCIFAVLIIASFAYASDDNISGKYTMHTKHQEGYFTLKQTGADVFNIEFSVGGNGAPDCENGDDAVTGKLNGNIISGTFNEHPFKLYVDPAKGTLTVDDEDFSVFGYCGIKARVGGTYKKLKK